MSDFGKEVVPVSVLDVAQFILNRRGTMSTMKLQKLTYYAQAWAMVWSGGPNKPLFGEDFEAWVDGPVCRELYDAHSDYTVKTLPGAHPERLSPTQSKMISSVIDHYGKYNGDQLSEITHLELPWREARSGKAPTDRSQRIISKPKMYEFYDEMRRDSQSRMKEAVSA
jgi:uncharacterized phage-associated protein